MGGGGISSGRGYLIAISLLVLEAMLALMITAQTASQARARVSSTPGERAAD